MAALFVTMALVLFLATPAHAVTLGFHDISGNNAVNAAIGEAQLTVDVSAGPNPGQVQFKFENAGPAPSSITDAYFDDGSLLAIAAVIDGPGVNFEPGASPPNLPSGNNASPPFVATFSADSEAIGGVPENGVNPTENVVIVFTLQGSQTFADTIAALTDGSLRIGIHVQAFALPGSESFVNNPVPEPATMFLMGTGLVGIAAWARRRLARAQHRVITT